MYVCIILVPSYMAVTTKLSIPIQVEVKANARDAYAESLKMILQHVADFHMTVVDIISEKYNIPVDEIMNTITSDSRYTNMVVDPKIHHLTSLNPNPNQNQVETSTTTVNKTTPIETITPVMKKPSEKKIKIKPKNSIVVQSSTSSSS